MRRKKAVKIVLFISAACLLFLETMVSSYATEESYETVKMVATPGRADRESEELTETVATPANAMATMMCLQIPQKLEIVIDPWELDGKGQIHSGEYIIQNIGNSTGSLTLNFTCKPQKDVIIRTDKEDLHDNERKELYIELVLGDETRILLERGENIHQVELASGEELSLSFTGEVNENADDSWNNGDFALEATYSWKMKEEIMEKNISAISGISEMKDIYAFENKWEGQ